MDKPVFPVELQPTVDDAINQFRYGASNPSKPYALLCGFTSKVHIMTRCQSKSVRQLGYMG